MKKVPILILHGWNLSSNYYDKLVNLLRSYGYKVLCFDLPGFGKSKAPLYPLTLSDYTDYVIKSIKSGKFDRVVIVGHSFGGRIGIKLAAKYPQLVHKLILTGTPGINPVPGWKVVLFRVLAKTGKLLFSIPVISLYKPLFRRILHRIAGASDYSKTSGVMRITFKNIINEDLKTYMRKIKSPTLLLWGCADRIVPVITAKKMSGLINKSKLIVFPASGHDVIKNNAEKFTETIISFLKYE